jgi:hypothetical protein
MCFMLQVIEQSNHCLPYYAVSLLLLLLFILCDLSLHLQMTD